MVSQDISETANRICMIALIAAAVVFAVARNIVRWWKAHAFQLEDFFLWLAVASYIAYCGMALATLPILTKLSALLAGELRTPWPTVQDDLTYLVKMIFAFQFLFWLTLWSVKFSLLWMFRRLTVDIPRYNNAWLAILIFTVILLIGCFVSNLTACHSFEAWFTPGECTLPTDTTRKAASLWYSLAADLITDMLIMAIPISLLWNLRISLLEKLSVAVAFSVGIITMIFAIIRCVALDATAGGGQVSTTWLIFWAATEGFVAILVGCLPPFAIFIRSHVIGSRYIHSNGESYSSGHPSSNSKSRARTQSIQLHDVELDLQSDANMHGDNSWLNGLPHGEPPENEVGRGY